MNGKKSKERQSKFLQGLKKTAAPAEHGSCEKVGLAEKIKISLKKRNYHLLMAFDID